MGVYGGLEGVLKNSKKTFVFFCFFGVFFKILKRTFSRGFWETFEVSLGFFKYFRGVEVLW